MLYKYAIFTAVMSVLPFLFIISDFNSSWHNVMPKFLCDFLSVFHTTSSISDNGEQLSQTDGKVEPLFTEYQIKSFTGDGEGSELYLAILGNVFDVTKGKRFYGPGENYHAFVGNTVFLE